jgi:hypothetical protein
MGETRDWFHHAMFILRVLLLFLLLPVCCLGPGFFVVRKLRWGPLEKLVSGIGLSVILVYLYAFGFFLAGAQVDAYYGASILCLVLLVLSWRDLAAVLRDRTVQRALLAYGVVLLWCLMLLSLVRHYSGGWWGNDCWEHYDRTSYFLGRIPHDYLYIDKWPLPARPPVMNIVCGFFLAQVGLQFDLFQVTSTFLDTLIFLACVLLVPALVPRAGRRLALRFLLLLFLASPTFAQNTTFAWTKLLPAFHVVLGLWLYRAGWKKHDSLRLVAGFTSLTTACLGHYSSVPYALFVGLHYLLCVWRTRQRKWAELLASAGIVLALSLPWFVWSCYSYGPALTFGANSTISDSAELTAEQNLLKMLYNNFTTLVPHPFRLPPGRQPVQTDPLGKVRDYFFLMYQICLPMLFGIIGWAGLAYLWWQNRRRFDRPQRRFWLGLVLFCVPVGVSTYGEFDDWGVAQVLLQPLAMVGLTFLAGALSRAKRWVVILLTAGMVFDFAIGVFLHVSLETQELVTRRSDGKLVIASGNGGLNKVAGLSAQHKHWFGHTFWGDHFAHLVVPIQTGLVVIFTLAVLSALRPSGSKIHQPSNIQ